MTGKQVIQGGFELALRQPVTQLREIFQPGAADLRFVQYP